MTDAKKADDSTVAGDQPTPSPEHAETQKKAKAWPEPGDEGFVHPDGTPQSERQLADNQQAAADRDAIGSGVHGAPTH